MNDCSVVIIGSGLSGLTSAFELLKNDIDFTVLEVKKEPGGRIQTERSGLIGEYGATWFGPQHTELIKLFNETGVKAFEQFRAGKSTFYYDPKAQPHHYEYPEGESPSFRVADGTDIIIQNLADRFRNKIQFKKRVTSLELVGDKVNIEVNDEEVLKADYVITTIPPRLFSERIHCVPEISNDLMSIMSETPTWMSSSIKFIVSYQTPFWRKKGYSGSVLSQLGSVIEVYDHTDVHERNFALMGFINPNFRSFSQGERIKAVLDFLVKSLGEEAANYKTYKEKDWSGDEFVFTKGEERMIPKTNYGHPLYQQKYMNGRLIISGTETSESFGGYMEGAVISGKRAAKKVIAALS
ncbi:MAG: FAD-dependent oxidoreductase [Bacteroidota bacterium]